MADSELDAMREVHAALLEERRNIARAVARLRNTRRLKGTLLPGDGAESGARILEIQQQIAAVEAIVAALAGPGV
ncbi:HOOK family protein [Methylobacterium sp. NEAU 140]|uniref:HOOK family protein n=1 Tax=Methylobacterium sp. NEAU 140 TaxID=3064945 RepID=UPI002737785B|nr:HOOK family protein [Methylobacterium sp. NEAU 140]MDP4024797.1 HOOK family protein [Methylobacterium sp. NEAU 140]